MNQALYHAMYNILTPVVRILYRKGVSFGEFRQLLKRVFVDVVADELLVSEGKATTSRIAVVTGMTRKDIAALRKEEVIDNGPSERYNRLARVLAGWQVDEEFSGEQGAAVLPRHGSQGSFDALVERYSGDMLARAVLDELLRLGAAEKQDDGSILPLSDSYLAGEDEDEQLSILGTDVGQLVSTIQHNLQCQPEERWYQRKVMYNNLPQESLAKFRVLANKENHKLLLKLNKWLAANDRDSNPDVKGTGSGAAAVGIYYYEEPTQETDNTGKHS